MNSRYWDLGILKLLVLYIHVLESLCNKYDDYYFENFHVRDKLIVQLSCPMKEHMMLYLVDHSEQNWFLKWKTRQRYEIILFLFDILNPKYRLYTLNWNHFSTSFQSVFHQWKFLFRRDWKNNVSGYYSGQNGNFGKQNLRCKVLIWIKNIFLHQPIWND